MKTTVITRSDLSVRCMDIIIKISLILIALLISVNIYSQERRPATYLSFIARAGINTMNLGDKYSDKSSNIGFQGGILLNYGYDNVFLHTGLEYKTINYDAIVENEHWSASQRYIQLPVHLGYRKDLSESTDLILHVGPYFAYGIGGSLRNNTTQTDYDTFSRRNGGIRFDYGLGLGVGLEINRFIVDLEGSFGVANLERNSDHTTRNQALLLTVGYRFKK